MSDEGNALIGAAVRTRYEKRMLARGGIELGLPDTHSMLPAHSTATKSLGSSTRAVRGARSPARSASGLAFPLRRLGCTPLGPFIGLGLSPKTLRLAYVRTRRLLGRLFARSPCAKSFEFLDSALGQPIQLARAGSFDLIDLFLKYGAQVVDDLPAVTHGRISRET